MTTAVPARSDIAVEHTWDLSRIYADWSAWDADLQAVEKELDDLRALRGTLGRSAAAFREAVEHVHDVRRRLGLIIVYASMRSDEDTRVGDHTARDGRAGTLAVAFGEAVSWFEPELLALDDAVLDGYLEADPELSVYGHWLDELRRFRPHTLDPEREALLAAAGNVTRGAAAVFNALNNADLSFPVIRGPDGEDVELTKARYTLLLRSTDRRVRRDAFEGFMDTYGGVINTLAANLDASVKSHVFRARARNHESCLHAALHGPGVPVEVFHSLVDTVRAGLSDVHRYTALKKRVLGVAELHEHDLHVPLHPQGEFRLDYDEACSEMLESLAPLGEGYVEAARRGVSDRWIDVHESVGKRSGAYSSGTYGTDPYILLNWSGQLRDAFTLTHEMGHSLHSWHTCRTQPYVYSHYPIFTAEVASTFNEMLLMRHLLDTTEDPSRRLFLLETLLEQINSTVIRQTMFAEMEHAMHVRAENDETLTAEILDAGYLEILTSYWGPDAAFDPVRSARTWCRIPHFYYNYYVYQYATAFAASAALSRRVLEGGAAERDDYLAFLASGDSRDPVDTLRLAGVDVTGPGPVEDVYRLFRGTMDEFESLLEDLGR